MELMARNPEVDDFAARVRALVSRDELARLLDGDEIRLSGLSLDAVDTLIRDDAGYYLLIAAANFNRTSLKRATTSPTAKIVQPERRRAYAIRQALPVTASFRSLVETSVSLRERDLSRKQRGGVEALLRARLASEGIPLAMSPPLRQVPALLVTRRKPDGVYPDPKTGRAPRVLLEIKSIRRVSDDIQKRLYEIAETSLEMKLLYGTLQLRGFALDSTHDIAGNPELRTRLRDQITASPPVVVAFFVCPRAEAVRYREGAEAFIDRVFFQDEVEDCIEFLRAAVSAASEPT
jgi:hypothetical protein